MNQTFSLPRFGRLLRKHFTDNRGQLLAGLALLIGLMIALTVVFYRNLPFAVDRNRPIPCFFLGWAAWYVFTWQQTDILNNKERSLNYLLQPASQLEKFVLLWLVSGVCFLTVYVLIFTVLDSFGVAYVNGRQWSPAQLAQIRNVGGILSIKPFYQSDGFWPPTPILVLTGLLHPLSTVFLLIVKRYSLPLVAVLAFCLFIGSMFLNSAILSSLTGSDSASNVIPFNNFLAQPPTGELFYRTISLPQPIGSQIRYAVGSVVVVLLYITAYFRLKEREV
ncbi:hypothetical protein [Spirosoma arcticum]